MSEYLEYHRSLLADGRRTKAYRDAIHRAVRAGDVVIDLGSGSGILAFFAAEAGASRVYAIDSGHMADVADLLNRHLGFSDRVSVLHAPSSKVELPEVADMLVTETMGPAGFDEGMLGFVLDARRRLLRPGATIVPSHLTFFAAPVQLDADYRRLIEWWSEKQYGFDLAPLRTFASNTMQLIHVDPRAHLAKGAALITVELATFETDVVRGRHRFTMNRDGTLHGFVVWFEARLFEGIVVANREKRGSHWSQGFLPLERPIAVKRGSRVQVDIETDDGRSWRWRGKASGTEFDQSSWLAMPQCDVFDDPSLL